MTDYTRPPLGPMPILPPVAYCDDHQGSRYSGPPCPNCHPLPPCRFCGYPVVPVGRTDLGVELTHCGCCTPLEGLDCTCHPAGTVLSPDTPEP
jgi:hypothetical protein